MANTDQSAVVAVFRDTSDAQAAADELKANGFTENDIYLSSYSSSDTSGTRDYDEKQHEGGIVGWFKRLFGEDDNADDRARYENAVNSGNVLLSVYASADNIDRAAGILEKHNPEDVHQDAASAASASTGSADRATTAAAAAGRTAPTAKSGKSRASSTEAGASEDLPKSIPVVKEDVRVGKRTVQTGGVRVYSRVIEQPVEESVRLQEEHVRVERQPVNRPVSGTDLQGGREQVIEVQEFAEEPVVSKESRVVEEVRISKDASERTETVRDTVRRTEVNVENLNAGSTERTSSGASRYASSDYDDDFRRDFESRYASGGGTYEDYAPAYQYGYQAASDPRYQGRSWDQVQSDLQSDYGRRYLNSAWERFKDSIRYGWDKVTGKTKSASGSSY
jgi:uncharacterized protein (TIGR02271 family)